MAAAMHQMSMKAPGGGVPVGPLRAAAMMARRGKRAKETTRKRRKKSRGLAIVMSSMSHGPGDGTWWQSMTRVCCRPRLRGETRRQYWHYVLESSNLSTTVDALQILLSLLLVGFYIYLSWDGADSTDEPVWMTTTELVFTVLFTLDYCLHFYAAEDRRAFVTSFFAVIDVVTILPVYVQIYATQSDSGNLDQVQSQFLRPMRVLRALRVLRAYRILSFTKSAVQRQLFMVMLTVTSVILVTTGIVQALEFDEDPTNPEGQHLTFMEGMYFIIVTVTTVGFGDFAPKSEAGRVTIMAMILASMVLIPTQVSKLGALLALRSPYEGAYEDKGHSHVIVCGDPPAHTLVYFLHEFFNASSKMTAERVVILAKEEPSYEVKRLLRRPVYESRVSYLRGSAMLNSDLWRAKAYKAKAAFVMLSSTQEDYEQMDTAASLLTSSIKLFTSRKKRANGRRCPVFTEVMATANVRHAQLAGAEEVLGFQHLKYSILAMTCNVPGYSTFVSNLLTTFQASDMTDQVPWLQEYVSGAQNEIYAAPFPEGMHGLTFLRAAEIIKAELDAVLIAVETGPGVRRVKKSGTASSLTRRLRRGRTMGLSMRNLSNTVPPKCTVVLCPQDYVVNSNGDRAILLCNSPTKAERISHLDAKVIKGYTMLQNMFQNFTGDGNNRVRVCAKVHAICLRELQQIARANSKDGKGWAALKKQVRLRGLSAVKRAVQNSFITRRSTRHGETSTAQRVVSVMDIAKARTGAMMASRTKRVPAIRAVTGDESDEEEAVGAVAPDAGGAAYRSLAEAASPLDEPGFLGTVARQGRRAQLQEAVSPGSAKAAAAMVLKTHEARTAPRTASGIGETVFSLGAATAASGARSATSHVVVAGAVGGSCDGDTMADLNRVAGAGAGVGAGASGSTDAPRPTFVIATEAAGRDAVPLGASLGFISAGTAADFPLLDAPGSVPASGSSEDVDEAGTEAGAGARRRAASSDDDDVGDSKAGVAPGERRGRRRSTQRSIPEGAPLSDAKADPPPTALGEGSSLSTATAGLTVNTAEEAAKESKSAPRRGPSSSSFSVDTMGATPYARNMLPNSASRIRRRRPSLRTGTVFDPVPATLVNLGRQSLNAAYAGFLHHVPPSTISKHIVCCGLPDSLADFVIPLRSHDPVGSVTPVVIVSVRKPTLRSYSRIMSQREVYYVAGSPRDPAALTEAGAQHSDAVVVLSNPSRHEDDPLLPEDDLMVDADAMTTLRFILELTEEVRRPPRVMVELIRGSNIKFVNYRSQTGRAAGVLDDTGYAGTDDEDDDDFHSLRHGSGELDFVLRPAFASGQVVTPHLIDGLLGAAYHKPYVVRTTQLLLGHAQMEQPQEGTPQVVVSPSAAHSLSPMSGTHNGLHAIDVPAFAHGMAFSGVFVRLLHVMRCVIVGVYRNGIGSPAPYLYTNPPGDLILFPADRLLVIGRMDASHAPKRLQPTTPGS